MNIKAVIDVGASSQRYFVFERHNGKLFLGSYDLENKCGNECNITRAEIQGEEKIFYFIGDRCQRYSAKKDEKKIKPPDLFKERQKIMEDACK
ncbi:unnamed protein product [marine sediment metagenome]|uniref:Uncharacterized protein n=1 Tax=marine sediment metagenome TaxID=412755 RepID=X1DJA2_9ZZZZ